MAAWWEHAEHTNSGLPILPADSNVRDIRDVGRAERPGAMTAERALERGSMLTQRTEFKSRPPKFFRRRKDV